MDPAGTEFAHLAADSALTPEETILVQQCLDVIPPDEARLVLEYHRRGAEELARELGITSNATRIRVHRIHKKIQELMARDLEHFV